MKSVSEHLDELEQRAKAANNRNPLGRMLIDPLEVLRLVEVNRQYERIQDARWGKKGRRR